MAKEEALRTVSLRAPSTAFSTRQYYAVLADSTEGYFKVGSSGANKPYVGVLQDAPTVAGEACAVAFSGISKIAVGSTALGPGSYWCIGVNGTAASSSEAVAKTLLMGPWLSPQQSTAGTIGYGFVDRVGITT